MSFSGTFVKKNKGLLVPEQCLRILLAKHPSFMTLVSIAKGSLTVDAFPKPSMEDVATAQSVIKDDDAVLYFGKYPDEYPEDSTQPFLLAGSAEVPQLLMYTDGAFENYAEAKSAHSPDFFAVQKYFKPKVTKWMKNGAGLKGVLEELNDASTKMDIRNSLQGRGSVIFLFSSGEIVMIQNKNPDFKEFSWGFMSNAYNYQEQVEKTPPAEEAKAEPKKKTGWFSKNLTNKGGTAAKSSETFQQPETPKTEDEVSDVDGSQHAKQEETEQETVTETAEDSSDVNISISWKPSSDIGATKAQKQKQYDDAYGIALWRKKAGKHYPESYRKGTPISMNVKASDIQEYIAKGWFLTNAPGKVVASGKKEQSYPERSEIKPKDTAPKHIPQTKAAEEEKGYKSFSTSSEGIVSKEEIERVKSTISDIHNKKNLDFQGKELSLDPAKIQSMEDKIPSATKQAGLDGLGNILGWSRPALRHFCGNNPEWFTELFIEVRDAYIKTLKVEDRPSATSHVKSAVPSVGNTKKQTLVLPSKRKTA